MFRPTRFMVTRVELEEAQAMPDEAAAALSTALRLTHEPIRGFYQASGYSPYAPLRRAEADVGRMAYELSVRLVAEADRPPDDTYLVAPYWVMDGEQLAARGIALWLRTSTD